ncbi:SusD family protein [Filimonas lacunae]|uniref:SusD family protein n=1 Tax=Filimonas lacunae TaxID=477680 RepID=A0A1N7N0S4_9BACT|nr:RagB/SusD family nutrient uptake outer membrane protein [Filimonas lacunae]SIS91791.1 SusD family protein [Filimonas lacunae]
MKKISLLLMASGIVLFSSCKKWLDVQPNSQVKESELFKTESGFKEALAGTYTILTEDALYGKELTYGMMGVLSHEWASFPAAYVDDGNYNYTVTATQARIDGIWSSMYKALSNANNILENIEAHSVFSGDNYKIIKGEALALRAFIHFDLLRCFGASYTVNASQPAIPYVTEYTAKQTAQLSVGAVTEKILADLLAAKELLKVDPVFTGRVVSEQNDNGYLMNRQLHLNYYAVEGLLARLYLYMGNYEQARISAQAVVNSGKFSFSTQANLIGGIDLCGAPEHLFALQITNLSQSAVNYLSQEGSGVFSLNQGMLLSYYENTIDYRYLYWFVAGENASANSSYLVKYTETDNDDSYYKNKLSVLKIAEMYYILAECDNNDHVSTLSHLNPVRKARGVEQLTIEPVDFRSYMTAEYRREFIGEGQLFYYYKRLNRSVIPESDKDLVALKAYIFPLPVSEMQAADRASNR